MKKSDLPVAIIGGGPVGLAAAAQLVVRGENFVLFESGSSLGTNFLDYGHVKLFSAWRYNMDAAAKELLLKNGFALPDADTLPFASEIAENYLQPLGQLPELAPFIHLNSRVHHIQKRGLDKMRDQGREAMPFQVTVENSGQYLHFEAKAVIDATGTWQQPNPLISGGFSSTDDSIHTRLPDILDNDRPVFAGKNVAVVGSGHSAFNSVLDLLELKKEYPGTQITWLLRRKIKNSLFGGGDTDQLAARGELGSKMKQSVTAGLLNIEEESFISQISPNAFNQLQLTIIQEENQRILGPFDEIIANTGSRPDFSFLREIRYQSDASLESVSAIAPLINPNIHSCGTVRPHGEKELRQPEKDFYIVGAKSYGRAPTFLLATGYEQVRSIIAYLTGDIEASERVELSLPETGVCSSRLSAFNILNNADSVCC
ncbi:NAD(P)-binding domain-containing protein [Planomicrobium sp. MB-3u-38]|uniref:NAD(P)-binding domain-containing protein n=1 Tax=Planomicrobium sp. MB-3u-38 TaxID=2058318 RepID=UPI000C7ADD4A|nr:NAD(P)-binding domain-containing protein [Planomicrobium sp. MB-3u-38]PKH08271.1 flavoprotein [Planomicrobium sp. MB-3u-38]